MKTIVRSSLALLALAAASLPALAEDPTFKIEIKEGVITPLEIEVPAGKKIRLEVTNTGASPVEFESMELKKEKVITGGGSASIVLRSLDPGTYDFYDEFHEDKPHGKIIAK